MLPTSPGPASRVPPAPLRLSPSRVAALRQCGRRQQWLEAHPQPRSFVESPASARGKSLHAALAAFHRGGGARELGLADLQRLLARHWLRDGYPDAEEERLSRLQAEADLARYYDTFGHDDGTLATERTWRFYRTLDGLLTEWHGRLDWLRRDQGLEIVDWKSGGPPCSPEALAADPATVMYGRLARSLAEQHPGTHEVGGWPRVPVRFSLIFLERAEKVTVEISAEMVRAAEAELAALARALLAEGPLPAAEGPWCMWNAGCPARSAGACPLFPPAPLEGEW